MTERLLLDIKYAHPEWKMSERQLKKELQDLYNRVTAPPEYMTLVIAHCIYNEAQFFRETLMDDLKINDVDIIHIMDGSWRHFDGTAQSNDGTIQIIEQFKQEAEKVGIKVIYESHPEGKIWESESEKRNYQFERIHQIVGNTPHYIMVKDGDETIHFLSGKKRAWMKMSLLKIYMDSPVKLGMINVNTWFFDSNLTTPRLFPSNEPYHYHTERSMTIHDGKCNLICDYNPTIMNIDKKKCFVIPDFIFINKLNIRQLERQSAKLPHVRHLEKQARSNEACKFNSSLASTSQHI